MNKTEAKELLRMEESHIFFTNLRVAEAIKVLLQEPEWIPCSERLPDKNQLVAFTLNVWPYDGYYFYQIGSFSYGLFICQKDHEYQPSMVGHWMPLPKPPTSTSTK